MYFENFINFGSSAFKFQIRSDEKMKKNEIKLDQCVYKIVNLRGVGGVYHGTKIDSPCLAISEISAYQVNIQVIHAYLKTIP